MLFIIESIYKTYIQYALNNYIISIMKTFPWVTSLAVVLLASCSHTNQSRTVAEDSKQEIESLKDAYTQLSQISGQTEDTIPIIKFGKYEVKVENNVGATNLDREQIKNTGNEMLSILDRVPMKYIVNGATNNLAAGFVYANQLSTDRNEVLIVACSGEAGMYSATYGIANDSTVYALRMSPLSMQGQMFTLTLEDTPNQQIYLINFYE